MSCNGGVRARTRMCQAGECSGSAVEQEVCQFQVSIYPSGVVLTRYRGTVVMIIIRFLCITLVRLLHHTDPPQYMPK